MAGAEPADAAPGTLRLVFEVYVTSGRNLRAALATVSVHAVSNLGTGFAAVPVHAGYGLGDLGTGLVNFLVHAMGNLGSAFATCTIPVSMGCGNADHKCGQYCRE